MWATIYDIREGNLLFAHGGLDYFGSFIAAGFLIAVLQNYLPWIAKNLGFAVWLAREFPEYSKRSWSALLFVLAGVGGTTLTMWQAQSVRAQIAQGGCAWIDARVAKAEAVGQESFLGNRIPRPYEFVFERQGKEPVTLTIQGFKIGHEPAFAYQPKYHRAVAAGMDVRFCLIGESIYVLQKKV